jgi:regulator of sigma E protease
MDTPWFVKWPETLLLLGIIICFHELGHYLAAKILGVKVDVFSFGVGKRLFGWRLGETDYRVSLLPLGGYVGMAGSGMEDDDGDVERVPSPRDFDQKSTLAQLAIMLAGPVFNFILALGLVTATYMMGVEVSEWLRQPARIGIVETSSAAASAGLAPGDVIVAVDGQAIDTWETLQEKVLLHPGMRLVLDVERDGAHRQVPIDVATEGKHAIGSIGVQPCARILVTGLVTGGPAHRADLRLGDEIAAVGGDETCSVERLQSRIQDAAGKPIAFRLVRDGKPVLVDIAAKRDDNHWRIGITPAEASVVEKYGFVRSMRASVESTARSSRLVIDSIEGLITRRLSPRSTSSLLEMSDITAVAVKMGLVPVLQLIALISVNVGIFNLVPIPILDGGRILILLVEAVRGRRLERDTKEKVLLLGLAIVVVLMSIFIWFDIIKKVEG